MKIAIITSGILPVPAVSGGAVENLIDFLLDYNNRHQLHDITVYSIYSPRVESHEALQSKVNHYEYIKADTLLAKIMKRLYKWSHREGYYFYTIEYYIDCVLRRMKNRQYDTILLENRPAFALKLKDITNARLCCHLHNAKLDTTAQDALAIYQAADSIITVSDFITQKVKTLNPADTKTVTVHNGIDLTAFTPTAESTLRRNDWGLDADDFVMLFNGKVNPQKGLMELIQAMKLLQDYPQIKLMALGSTFYGGNTYDDHPYARRLLKEAEPVKDRITFTGYVDYSQIPAFLHISDVAVIPSVWDDPFPTTVLEAQAVGLPIITTRRGGIPEEVSEENAILLDTDERFVENLAEAILDLYQHPDKRARMAEASRRRSQLFEKDTFAGNFFKVLDQLV